MTELKQYSKKEVEAEKTKKLLIIHDKVYDVSVFLNEHPGGEEVLLEHAGKEASEDFDDVGHSADALELMKKYLIGELVESERSNKKPKQGWVAGQNPKVPEKQAPTPGMPIAMLIGAIVVLNLGIYYFSKSSS